MRRGEVWWADLDPPVGRRPVVLLSRDDAYSIRSFFIAILITTRARGIAAEVPLGPEDGLPRRSVANLDVIITIAKDSLIQRVSQLSESKIEGIEAAVHYALGMKD